MMSFASSLVDVYLDVSIYEALLENRRNTAYCKGIRCQGLSLKNHKDARYYEREG